ncbi:MAG: MFS transporter [Bradyrhizobiaceae bacterium]|nr:MFS transporter [Bradyrhizobiaceae bacterium]
MDARRLWLTFGLLWLAGMGLRLTVLAIPPVLPLIEADLGLTGTQIGVLNGLPVILFALAALPGALLIARYGALPALVTGLLLAGIASALRGVLPNLLWLYAMTIVMGVGIAVMQPAMPALVREWVPQRIGFATAIYTNGLLVGEVIPVALTLPLVLPLVDGSWRGSLAFWGLPMIVIAGLMVFAPRSSRSGYSTMKVRPRWWPDWRDPKVWQLGFILSSVNTAYFNANAFIPGHLTYAGRPDLISATLTALNLAQLPASFLLLTIARRVERRAWPLIATGIIILVALIGIAFTASVWTVAFAALLGFVGAITLALGLTLPALLADSDDVARTSAAMFTVSYALAMLFSIASGAAWDLAGDPRWAFLPTAISVLPQILLISTIRFPRPAI